MLVICISNFKVQGSAHRKYILMYIQQDAMLHSLFISANYSTCFGWYLHPSSGAHTTVSTASDTCQTVTATYRYRGRFGTETALHVSGGISTHHQEHTQLYLQHLELV